MRDDLPEAQLKAALNMIPAHTWYAVPSGTLTFVNERTADFLGLSLDHHLRIGTDMGASWDSHIALLHPDDHDESRRAWSNCLRSGCAGEANFRIRNAQGGYRWFISRAEPLRTSDGTLRCWIGINFDIDERKQAEFYLAEGQRLAHTGSWSFGAIRHVRCVGTVSPSGQGLVGTGIDVTEQEELSRALRKSEETLRLLVDGIDALVIIMAADDKLEFVNQRVLDYFGKNAEEMTDWRKNGAIHPDDLGQVIAAWTDTVRTGSPYDHVHRFRRFDGEYRWFRVRGRPGRNAQDHIIRWYVILTDIDQAKIAEERLKEQQKELQQVLDLAPQMVAVLGTETRYPHVGRVFHPPLCAKGGQDISARQQENTRSLSIVSMAGKRS